MKGEMAMFPLASDENLDDAIVTGLLQRYPTLDLVRIKDVGLSGASDPDILEWAASENRILLTHDRATMPGFAYERVNNSKPMPGVVIVSDHLSIGDAIQEILILVNCSTHKDWENQVIYIPL
jgi:hypothetical protein